MQKNIRSMAKNAFLLATTVLFALTTQTHAQELPKTLISINQPGVYGLATNKPLHTLLIPVNPADRWNVVYQQTPHTPVVSSIQFHPELHVFVAQPDTELVAVINPAPESTKTAQLGSVHGAATPSATPVITINKTAPISTPAPTPVPTPKPVVTKAAPLAPSELDALFAKYGAEYGVSPDVLKRIAQCESGLRPEALSSNGLYGGLFQFVSGTWSSNRRAMGLDPDPALRFNAEEAIKTGAFKISRDGIGAWPHCGRKAVAATGVASL